MITEKGQIKIRLQGFGVSLTGMSDEEKAAVASQISDDMTHERVADVIKGIVNRRVQVLSKDGVHKRIKVEDPEYDNMAKSGPYQILYEA